MANPTSAVDLHQTAEAYEAANAALYGLKVNRLSRWLPIDSRDRAVAQWANLIDDFMLEAQELLRLSYNGSGSPESNVAAPAGAVYLNTEASPTGSRMWIKATGSGTTGWEQVGGALGAGDVTLANLEDAPGLSVLARAGTGTGVRADLASGGARRVLASNSGNTAIAFRALEAADIPALAYAPTGAMTASGLTMATARLLGRTTASTGAVEEISVTSPLTLSAGALGIDVSTIELGDLSRTLYHVNFANLASNTLTDGSETIDGLGWTVAGSTLLGTMDVSPTNGLRLLAGNALGTNATFTSASQTAPHLYLPLSSLPNWNSRYGLVIEIYMSTLTLETNGEHVFVALWVPSGPHSTSNARVRRFGILNNAGTRVVSQMVNASSTTGTEAVTTHTVVTLALNTNGIGSGMTGVYSSDFPAAPEGGMAFSTNPSAVDPFNRGNARLVIGLGVANDASPTTGVVIEQLRVSVAA